MPRSESDPKRTLEFSDRAMGGPMGGPVSGPGPHGSSDFNRQLDYMEKDS
jgi:hypothetical protein